MKFGPLPLDRAGGAVLAHSLRLPGHVLKKGETLTAADLNALREAGLEQVVAARLEAGDVPEDMAAARIAAALEGCGLSVGPAFAGRANVFAEHVGLIEINGDAIAAANAVDDSVAIATLPDLARVEARRMVATVKIIPYAAPGMAVARAAELARGALRLRPVVRRTAGLALTVAPGMKDSVVGKGAQAVRDRLAALGVTLLEERRLAHDPAALAEALGRLPGDILLILTASATSDRADVGPAALLAADGRLERFGMPVDPGNLLFLGALGARPVIGLPGCARAPRLNGADWVLERVACGLDPSARDIAAMGVGGLLKEIPARPQPRLGVAPARRPVVGAVLLAAGASRRMGGRDKLLEEIDGAPLLRRAARMLARSRADHGVVVLGPDRPARAAALEGLEIAQTVNPAPGEGMASSIRAGLAALPPDCDAALICLADMPDVGASHLDRLIAAFDPEAGRAICRAVDALGRPGHPILFGRRFFEALSRLEGDRGARAVIAEHEDYVTRVPMGDAAPTLDLDTAEDWAAWRAGRGAADANTR